MDQHAPKVVLHLTAPVRVTVDAEVLHVRRMGLAILAYLALEGPTRRERLADVVWGHRRGLPNLRVELHRLRAAFAATGIVPLQATVDLVALTSAVEVAPVTDLDEFLAGLDDVSSAYQAWLERRRDLAEHATSSSARARLLDALATAIRPPFVLVVQGVPGSGRRTLAQALAQRLHLRFTEGIGGEPGGLRYLPPDHHDADGLATRIRRDPRSVWVLGRSAYGADPRLLLELRASLPPERLRFEALAPLTWPEARRGFLAGLPFERSAGLYLASAGHPACLRELVALRAAHPEASALPVPQRVRAALALEATRLSATGQRALERLSVLGSRFTPAMVTAADADAALDELERNGWLVFEGDAWRFADPVVARVLRSVVPSGQRARLLRAATDAGSVVTGAATAGRSPPVWAPVVPGRPVYLDAPRRFGDDADRDADALVWARLATANGASGFTWALPDGRHVARVAGQLARDPDASVAAPDDPTVWRLSVLGAGAPSVRFAPRGAPLRHDDGAVWLPTEASFERWFLLPPGARGFELACHAAAVVLALDVDVYQVDDSAPTPAGGEGVAALDLSAPERPAARLDRPRSTGPTVA